MPKHLFLCRHAHTLEAFYRQKDFDRELSPRGLPEAAATGDFISAFGLKPDGIICSPALRTRQTADIIAQENNFDLSKIEVAAALYEASSQVLLKVLESLSAKQEVVILLGHNPAVSEVAGKILVGKRLQMPTGGCCYFSFAEADWAAVTWADFKLKCNF